MQKLFICLILYISGIYSCAQDKNQSVSQKTTPNLIADILEQGSPLLKNCIVNDSLFHIQIIYTQINRDSENRPAFTTYTYSIDSNEYYYPASLVKLPTSLLALEKINELTISSLTRATTMLTDSADKCQHRFYSDPTSANKLPSLEHYIKRMLLISDNDAYSRVFEFLGREYINKKLSEKGYNKSYIIHRFDPACSNEENKITNPIRFVDSNSNEIYSQPPKTDNTVYSHPLGIVKVGKGYVNAKNKLVNEPKDFTYTNYLPLQNIHEMIVGCMFPDAMDKEIKFNLTANDYRFIREYMQMIPRKSNYPKYNSKEFYDCYKKYLLYGADKKAAIDTNLRIFNIVGQSYGYLSDCAYICDLKNKAEFALSAVIYVNKDGILNDGKYEYETIGFPFLKELGQLFYTYELSRERTTEANLEEFVYK